MLDSPNDSHNNDLVHTREGASQEGNLLSDKLGLPLLTPEPAPLSQALHAPTLLNEDQHPAVKTSPTAPKAQDYRVPEPANDLSPAPEAVEKPASMFAPMASIPDTGEFDRFGRARSGRREAPANTNRATTPADAPREDSATWVGVPSNHPKTEHSGKIASLDKIAIAVGGVMVIGPLFAAMIGRMAI